MPKKRGFFKLVVSPDTIRGSERFFFALPQSRPIVSQGGAGVQAACPLCCNMASSRDHKNPYVPLLFSVVISQLVHLSIPLFVSFAQPILFPLPPSPYVYRQPYFTLDRATLMYVCGSPFEQLSLPIHTGKPFFTWRQGASATSNVAQGCYYHPYCFPFAWTHHSGTICALLLLACCLRMPHVILFFYDW